jgi:hypothetical protein
MHERPGVDVKMLQLLFQTLPIYIYIHNSHLLLSLLLSISIYICVSDLVQMPM